MVQFLVDSDSDLPEIGDLVKQKPHALPTRRTNPQKTHAPSIRSKWEQYDASISEPFQASLRLQSNDPRRQRPLKKISNNVVSLPTSFGIPGRKRSGNPHSIVETRDEKSIRRSPSRKSKVAASEKEIEIDESSSGQENSDASFVDLCSSSEEEEVDTDIDIWMQPKSRQQRSLKRNETKAEFELLAESRSGSEGERHKSSSLPFAPTLLSPLSQIKPVNVSRPSSSEDDKAAILTYEPPSRRSPIKCGPPQSRPHTPSPPPSPSKFKLVSPSKITSKIPPTPHHPSIDAFWAPDVVNAWNEQYSPRKVLTSPSKMRFMIFDSGEDEDAAPSPSALSRKSPSKSNTSPAKKDKAVIEARKAFEARKTQMASEFLAELDERITSGRIAELAASTGGVKVIWSKKLNSTAGRAHWRRECIKLASGHDGKERKEYKHHASIELAEKVIKDEHRLINVLAHEFCHLANFMISDIKGNPHGKEFKEWARKCMRVFGSRGVEVTTKHSYEIDYKFVWECVTCRMEYKRHSKSVDVERHSCGACKGKLVQTKPPVRSMKKSDYQVFVKENFAKVKGENPESSHGTVMGILGKMYKEQKRIVNEVKMGESGIENLTKTLEIVTLDN